VKITKSKLKQIIKEEISNLTESENPIYRKFDFQTVYDAMLQFYEDNPKLMADAVKRGNWQEVQERELDKYGWTWREYTKRSEAEAKAHEERLEKYFYDKEEG